MNEKKETISIITPQFERTWKLEYDYKPSTDRDFMAVIERAPIQVLVGLGFGKWDTMNNIITDNMGKPKHNVVTMPTYSMEQAVNVIAGEEETPTGPEISFDFGSKDAPTVLLEVDEQVLLFPGEWYEIIPNGFMVTGLDGETYPFKHGESDDDIRFGCLPYGIRRQIEANLCKR